MIDKQTAARLLEQFEKQRILVVGDLMLDRYVYGGVSRISPEAPVPIVRVTGEEGRAGGAANVAHNIRTLGGQAKVAGCIGADREGADLLDLLSSRGVDTGGIIRSEHVNTTVKTRVVAERQQVVRVDREDVSGFSEEMLEKLCGSISALAEGVTGIVVEDYGKGAIYQQLIDTVAAVAARCGVPVGFDPKNTRNLRVQGITVATPNYGEARAAVGLPLTSSRQQPESAEELDEVARALMEKWRTDLLLVTLGPQGMYLRGQGCAPCLIPARAREVYDVSGAGDTVMAVVLLALASGATYTEAAMLANVAAGVVVGKLGTATCTPDELLAGLE